VPQHNNGSALKLFGGFAAEFFFFSSREKSKCGGEVDTKENYVDKTTVKREINSLEYL